MQRREPVTELIGRQVGRYTVVSHLASGGMAELYIARQEAVGGFEKNLVLKMLQGQYAENPRVVRMFLDEARVAAKLNHPSIVHVYDVAEEEGIKYIAMEYIHGETVIDIVRRGIAVGNYLPLEHAVHITSQAAAGLAYAHGRHASDGRQLGIVHRDVSPSNILVSYEGQTKIVDFGIARIQDQIREESGMRPGKASYMSPEQVNGENVDYRSDIFSLGIILYELTVGQRLWRGPADEVMKRIVDEKIPPPTYVKRDYPPALELIVMKALEKRAADRYQSAEDMRNDLEEFLDEEGFRTGSRRVAAYLKELFAPEAAVSDDGLALSRQVADPGPASQEMAGDSEELNFDRRASLAMRVEAAPLRVGGGGEVSSPVPSAVSGSGASQSTGPRRGAGEASGLAGLEAVPGLPPLPPLAPVESFSHGNGAADRAFAGGLPLMSGGASAVGSGPSGTNGHQGLARLAAELSALDQEEARNGDGDGNGAPGNALADTKLSLGSGSDSGAFTHGSAAAGDGSRAGSGIWLVLMVVVLVGIGAMVFVVMK